MIIFTSHRPETHAVLLLSSGSPLLLPFSYNWETLPVLSSCPQRPAVLALLASAREARPASLLLSPRRARGLTVKAVPLSSRPHSLLFTRQRFALVLLALQAFS